MSVTRCGLVISPERPLYGVNIAQVRGVVMLEASGVKLSTPQSLWYCIVLQKYVVTLRITCTGSGVISHF